VSILLTFYEQLFVRKYFEQTYSLALYSFGKMMWLILAQKHFMSSFVLQKSFVQLFLSLLFVFVH